MVAEQAAPDLVARAVMGVAVWPVWPEVPAPDRFVPVTELVEGGVVGRICERLVGAPRRVGESALVIGLASRLWSLSVVPAVTHGVVVDPAVLRVADDHGVLALGITELRGTVGISPDGLHDLLVAVLAPAVAASSLADRLLWGNVAASLAAVPRTHDLPHAAPLVEDLLSRVPLAGELEPPVEGRSRRRTCCLFYLVPGAGLCGDCVLPAVPARAGTGATD